MVKWEYDKPPNDDNASENKDEEEDVHKPNLDVGKHEQIHDRDDLHHQQPRNQSLSLSFIFIGIFIIHELVYYNFLQPMLSCSTVSNSACWRPEAYLPSISINLSGHLLV